MPWLAHLSHLKRRRQGDLTSGPLAFAGVQAQGDEYNQPTSVVIDVGRRFVIEADEFDGQVLALLGEGHGQYMRFDSFRLTHAARMGWYGLTLLCDTAHEPEPEEVAA